MAEYNLRFYDTDINLVGELDDAEAIIWPMKFRSYGKFKLHFRAIHPECFQKNFYVKLDRDAYKTGIITSIKAVDDDYGVSVTVEGMTLNWLLSKRVTIPPDGYAQYTFTGTGESAMINIAYANAGAGAGESRDMGFTFPTTESRGDVVSIASRYKNLADELTSIGELTGLGYAVYLDTEQKYMGFSVLEGTDRTWSGGGDSVMCFSPKNDNVLNREYREDSEPLKTTAYVGGQGEGANRTIVLVGDGQAGLARSEMFVDARDISDTADLTLRGEAKLAEHPAVNCYTSDVDASGFEDRWFLGDFVSVRDAEYGISEDYQVTEVTIEIDRNGRNIRPTFGVAPKTNGQRITQASTPDAIV